MVLIKIKMTVLQFRIIMCFLNVRNIIMEMGKFTLFQKIKEKN